MESSGPPQASESRENRSWRYHLQEKLGSGVLKPQAAQRLPDRCLLHHQPPGGGPVSHARSPRSQARGVRGAGPSPAEPTPGPGGVHTREGGGQPRFPHGPGSGSRETPRTGSSGRVIIRRRRNGPRRPSNRRACGGWRGVRWASPGRARPAGEDGYPGPGEGATPGLL